MRITDIKCEHMVNSVDALESAMLRRYPPNYNAYWLSHNDSEYPTLSVLVKGNISTLSYLVSEHNAGFRSSGEIPGLDLRESTVFQISINRADDLEIGNDAIIPFQSALAAAKEFFYRDHYLE